MIHYSILQIRGFHCIRIYWILCNAEMGLSQCPLFSPPLCAFVMRVGAGGRPLLACHLHFILQSRNLFLIASLISTSLLVNGEYCLVLFLHIS